MILLQFRQLQSFHLLNKGIQNVFDLPLGRELIHLRGIPSFKNFSNPLDIDNLARKLWRGSELEQLGKFHSMSFDIKIFKGGFYPELNIKNG